MANYGLQVKDAAGGVSVRITDQLPRWLGYVDTGRSNGSISVPEFAGRSPWVAWAQNEDGGLLFLPEITVSGTTLSWTFPLQSTTYRRSTRINYGVIG